MIFQVKIKKLLEKGAKIDQNDQSEHHGCTINMQRHTQKITNWKSSQNNKIATVATAEKFS